MFIPGTYLDGKTSKRLKARLEVLYIGDYIARVHIDHEGAPCERLEIHRDQLKVESRLGNTPRELLLGNEQLFITEDHDGVDELSRFHEQSSSASFIHKLESNLPLIVISTVVTAAIIWALIIHGIPYSAKTIADNMPDLATDKLETTLGLLDQTLFSPSQLKQSQQQEIQALLAPYITAFSDLKPNVVFRSSDSPNAFALPDGNIVFTDDFINLVTSNEELLAVFFHEIGHLKHKHLIRRALQDSMVTLLVILVTGDLDSIDVLTGLPTLLMDLNYSRQFEVEADTFALQQMQHYEISVQHFATIMKRLAVEHETDENTEYTDKAWVDKKSISDFLSTHPPTRERLELIESYKNSPAKNH